MLLNMLKTIFILNDVKYYKLNMRTKSKIEWGRLLNSIFVYGVTDQVVSDVT